MTNDVGSDLLKLAERCEAATGPDRVLDAEIYVDLDPELENLDALAINGVVGSWVPDFTASLDAAMTLVPEGMIVALTNVGVGSAVEPDWTKATAIVGPAPDTQCEPTEAATLPLALCAGALRARAQKEEQ